MIKEKKLRKMLDNIDLEIARVEQLFNDDMLTDEADILFRRWYMELFGEEPG